MSVAELYRTIVLAHGKQPRNRGPVAGATHAADGDNPLCGDAVRVEVVRAADVLSTLGFTGEGCVLVTASASLMTERLRGGSVAEARALADAMERWCGAGQGDAATLGDLVAFGDVHRHPARVACALLPWRTLVQALGD